MYQYLQQSLYPPLPSTPTVLAKFSQIKNPRFPSRKSQLLHPKPNPHPLSKLQAFQSLVLNLESSIKNGISLTDPQLFASLLESCFQLGAVDYVPRIHKMIPQKLLRKNTGISSKLLRLYACNGQVDKAHEVFDVMPERNSSAFPWNSLISGYAEARQYEDALALYFQMVEEGMEPDQYTYPRALKACGGIGMIQVGEEVHRHVIRYGFGNDTFVLNAFVDMYSKCGDIVRARKVFNAIGGKDLVSWNTMIVGYVKHGIVHKALYLLQVIAEEVFNPDSITLSSVLSSLDSIRPGVEIHGWAIRRGMEWDPSIANALLLFYSNHNLLPKSRQLFDSMPDKDVVSWNSMISSHSNDSQAMEYFNRMISTSNISPDEITFVALLSSCAHLGLVREGERVFSMMVERFGVRPSMEHYGCMVNLYGRSGMIEEAYELLVKRMGVEAGPTVWGALLYSCCLHGNVEIGEIAATNLFEIEPENEHNFELLIKIYEKAGKYEEAERVRPSPMDPFIGEGGTLSNGKVLQYFSQLREIL